MGGKSNAKIAFLRIEISKEGGVQRNKQKKIECLTGMNWLIFELVRDLAKSASQIASDFELMRGWGDWPPPRVEGDGGSESDTMLWVAPEQWDRQDAGSVNFEASSLITKNKTKDNIMKTKSKKRGKATKSNLLKGQRLMDVYVMKVNVVKPKKADSQEDDGDELLLCKAKLEKQYKIFMQYWAEEQGPHWYG